ncbi:MAG TPA: hypothetical protein VG826_30155 [Pirellulales bacterium]|nr:hypothetical protein [Pirellulales bacterium]
MNLVAMPSPNAAFDFVPIQTGGRVFHEVRLSPRDLLFLPFVDWHIVRCRRKVVPKVLHELQLFCGAQVKNRKNWRRLVRCHESSPQIPFAAETILMGRGTGGEGIACQLRLRDWGA